MRFLGVLLCYNDGDLLPESIEALLESGHDVVAWDHGSTDDTASVLARYRPHLTETRFVPRSFDFYELYPAMSRHLIAEYVPRYDWISWPDQDEFLEGPDRSRSYREWVEHVHDAGFDWIRFTNVNFWLTAADDPAEPRTQRRVRHYSAFLDCSKRIRSWRATSTNLREFNHNPPAGVEYPTHFRLRHYPMRTAAQLERRLAADRSGLRRGGANYHYENMAMRRERLVIPSHRLHYDDGVADLDPTPVFDWRSIYGLEASLPEQAHALTTPAVTCRG